MSIAPPIGKKYEHWIPRSDYSLRYWSYFEASNYQSVPFAGGLADQPQWLTRDFNDLAEITEYFELMVEMEDLQRRLADV